MKEGLRARFSASLKDSQALAIIAGDLIKAGDGPWLRTHLLDPKFPEGGKTAILSAFRVNKDISALEEILVLSTAQSGDGLQERCRSVIRDFLEDPGTRGACVKKLLQIAAAKDKPLNLQVGAVKAIGEARDLAAMDMLIELLHRHEPPLQGAAVEALRALTLQDFGTDAAAWKAWWEKNRHRGRDRIIEPVLLARLAAARKEAEALEAQKTSLALRLIDENPVQAAGFLEWKEPEVRRRAAEVIRKDGAEALSPEVLERVAAHLEAGESDEAVLCPLLELLGAAGLGKNGKAPAEGVRARYRAILISYLRKGARPSVKVTAAASLKGYGDPELRRMVAEILEGLKDRTDVPALQAVLLERLAEFGPAEEIPLITAFLKAEKDKVVRERAIFALGEAGSPEAIDRLSKILVEEPDMDLRFEAVRALTRLGQAARDEAVKARVVSALEAGLRAREPRVRGQTVIGLGRLKPENGIDLVTKQIETEGDPGVLGWCIGALGEFKDPGGLPRIAECLAKPGMEKGAEREALMKQARTAVESICGEEADRWITAAESLYEKGQFDLVDWCAKEYFNRFKGKNAGDGDVRRMEVLQAESGIALSMKIKDLKAATETARRLAEEIAPEDTSHQLRYARILVQGGDFKKAAEVYRGLLSRLPKETKPVDLWRLRLEGAACFLEAGDPRGALDTVQGFPIEDPNGLPGELKKRYAEIRAKAEARFGSGGKSPPEGEKNGGAGKKGESGVKKAAKPTGEAKKKGVGGTGEESLPAGQKREGDGTTTGTARWRRCPVFAYGVSRRYTRAHEGDCVSCVS